MNNIHGLAYNYEDNAYSCFKWQEIPSTLDRFVYRINTIINWWCPKYVDELFTNLDSAGLSQKDINTFMTLPIN
ncbi:hypothetical protein MTBBW1_1210032 [Desulfamplus magnetovallimortis]|uniref:Uncharacterized protein n=1 Tax=Desulfamplus magnetovallimortis TaxID=1246637 RepID=A0A1W1H6A8_9BACT|nr:hypothetical protein [Desulfamplus magnetovallimortis]SLM27992.1 hypothetical protein MTBBW1_1210032 [Desulfamplus magnetovallimortis]